MESSDSVYVIAAEFSWNDLGTWGSLYNELSEDNQSVSINADLLELEGSGNVVSTSNVKKVVIKGVSDLIVVEQDGVIVILPKSQEQEIKQLRNAAMEKYGKSIG